MSVRKEAKARVIIDGRPHTINLISNPTIEDVVATEMRLQAAEIDTPGTVPETHRVSRSIKDFLVRLKVER